MNAEQITWKKGFKNRGSRAFRTCPGCGAELPRHGNKASQRCRKCNAKEMGKRNQLKAKLRREKSG